MRGELNSEFGEKLSGIDEVTRSVHDTRAFRTGLEREISVIEVEAQSMLDQLGVPALEA